MKQKDMERRKNEKLNDLELEAKENAEHLLSKANAMRQEQEDEIKHLNEVINNTTLHSRLFKIIVKFHFFYKIHVLYSEFCMLLDFLIYS